MITPTLSEFFERELRKLSGEIALYPDDASPWTVSGTVSNSAGNLCLHLIGNLNHFIGAALGNTGYLRDRDREFADRNVPREVLLQQIESTLSVVKNTLASLTDADLEKDFPFEKQGKIVKTGHMLLHLLGHLNYHLGQINYHRRQGV